MLLNGIEYSGDNLHFYGENCFDGGNGSAIKPFLISNVDQFNKIEKFPAASYKQISDFDFENGEYEAKFKDVRFEGYYDGNNKQFVNITSDQPIWQCVGENGIIKNVIINKSNFTSPSALVYDNYGTISDCSVNANITHTSSSGNIHMGLVAGGNYGIIINCTATGDAGATAKKYQAVSIVGGICGYNDGKIISCYSDTDVSAVATDNYWGGNFAGGIAGVNNASGFIQSCNASGAIKASTVAGGVVGKNEGQVNNSLYNGSSAVTIVGTGNGIVN